MNLYTYISAMAITTYLIRMLPMTIFRKPIRSRFIRSLLYYVPYACLTAMTFPAILLDSGAPFHISLTSAVSGGAALAVAVFLSYRGKSLLVVAIASAAAVFIAQRLLGMPI